MAPTVPKDKLPGHMPLGDRGRIGGNHLRVRILGFSTRPAVRQQLCLESSEEALLHFDPPKKVFQSTTIEGEMSQTDLYPPTANPHGHNGPQSLMALVLLRAYEVLRRRCRAPTAYGLCSSKAILSFSLVLLTLHFPCFCSLL